MRSNKEKAALERLRVSFEERLDLNNDLRKLIEADGSKATNSPRAAVVDSFVAEWENGWTELDLDARRAILRRAALKLFAEAIQRIHNKITPETALPIDDEEDD